jgi:NAD+ diphosphatase
VSVPALSRGTVDRDVTTREDEAALAAAWERARVVVVDAGRVLVDEDGDRPRLHLLAAADAPAGERLYLGTDGDQPFFAVAAPLAPRPGQRPADLRMLGTVLDDRDAGLLVHAVGLVNWHVAHPRCARCGALTQVVRGGSVRRCPEDGSEHFPRTDPAVIVLVTDGADRCVLGHRPGWPDGRYSTLAGFVEPGESAEQAVVREMREEAGVEVRDVRYLASQPWPFPSSLMLAFFAVCDGDATLRCVDSELDDVRWFDRAELRSAADWGKGSGLQLPGAVSIARHLLDTWMGAARG